MAFNIAQVGVDKKSGAPIIQRSSNFIYNNDPNGTRDIFYYFGSRLKSSTWVNPNSTSFITASRLNSGGITGPADNAVDNNTGTALFSSSTDETDGFQVQFNSAPFKLIEIQLNTDDPNWVVEGSNDGTSWTNIPTPGLGNLGNNWYLISVTNNTFYSYYRILHAEAGISKTFGTVKFFGEYDSGDIAPGIEENATFLATHKAGPGVVYLPDASAENFPENYYCTVVHFKTGEYTYQAFPGGGTSVIDNTNGVLRQGEQLLAVVDNGNWELFKVGSGVDLTTKGTLITSDGIETTFLSVGPDGSFLVADSAEPNGLKYQTLNLNTIEPPTSTVNFNNQRITGVGAPTSPTDAVTKNYADSIAAGFDPKASCDVATTDTLNAMTGDTWTPAGSGIGKTLTSTNTSATIDTILLQNGLRVLVKDQANAADNGIYVVSGVGSAVTLTRAEDFNTSTNVTPGAFTFITNGVENGATGFILLGNGTLVVDTNDLNFSQFAGAGAVTLSSLPDTSLTPLDGTSTGRFVGWNDATGFFELYEKAGTGIDDLVKLEDVGGNPGLPAVDGTQVTISPTQVSPLNTKGDVWIYNGSNDTRLPAGPDNNIAFTNSGTATGFEYREPTSNDLTITYTPTEFQVNFNTGTNTVELGPLHIDDSLTPNDDEFLRYDAATSRFIAEDPTGTNIGDIVVLEDVGGNPAMPNVDGSQLTNLNIGAGQGSPLATKGDIYAFDGSFNIAFPVGIDDEILVADSTTPEGLAYKDVREVSRFYTEAVTNGGISRDYVSDGDANGIIYFIGTQEGTQGWVEPTAAGLLDIYINVDSSATSTGNHPLVDRSSAVRSFSANSSNIIVDALKEDYFLLERLSFKFGSSLSNIGSTGNFIVRVGQTYEEARTGTGSSETLIDVDPTTLGWTTNTWFNYDFTPLAAYRYVYIRWSSTCFIEEIEFYGEANPAPLSYNVIAQDEKGTIVVPPVSQAALILPVGLPQGFSFFVQNRGITTTTLVSDGSSTVVGASVIYNEGDLLVVTNIGSDTWISSNISSIQLENKGELLTFTDKPSVLSPGTTGQVLVANSNSAEGIRWEDRAGADDLIYAKEIPSAVLGHTTNDIFEYIGRDRDITFTSPFTNPADGIRIIVDTNTSFGVLRDDVIELTDQSNSSNALQLQQNGYGEWHFQTVTVQPYEIAIYHQANPSDTDWDVQVSNDGSSWETVGTLPANGVSVNTWVTTSLNVNGYYSYLRVINTTSNTNLWINEIKLFGWVKDNPQIGEIFSVGPTGITAIAPGTDNYALIADSGEPAGVKWVQLDESLITASTHTKITTAEETLSGDKTLLVTEASVQVLDPGGASREVILPDPPEQDLYFKIVNADAANFSIDIKETAAGSVVQTLDIDTPYVEAHYTGSNWLILG